MPDGGVVEGALDDQFSHCVHERVVSGQGQELVGVEQSAFGVVPAHQRLHPDDLAAAQAHLGLVMHSQVAVLDGMAQLGEQFHPGAGGDASVCVWRVDHVAGMGVFGPVHRDVGMAQHGSQFAAVLGAERRCRCWRRSARAARRVARSAPGP